MNWLPSKLKHRRMVLPNLQLLLLQRPQRPIVQHLNSRSFLNKNVQLCLMSYASCRANWLTCRGKTR